MLEVAFTAKDFSVPYDPPERDPRDGDRASRVYLTMHRIHGEHRARVVDESGEILDIHPADVPDVEYLPAWGDSLDRLEVGEVELPEGAIIVDAVTAGVIVGVADNLSDNNRANFLNRPIVSMGYIAWTLVGGVKRG